MIHSKPLTVEVLTVQLLNEHQHHSIDRPLPQRVPRRETFQPGSFSTIVLCVDGELQFTHEFIDKLVLQRHRVQVGNDLTSLVYSPGSEKMSPVPLTIRQRMCLERTR